MLDTLSPHERTMRGTRPDGGITSDETSVADGRDLIAGDIEGLGWDRASLDPLRHALEMSGGADRLSNGALREALRPMCLAGQKAGRRVEEMIVLLKTLWPTLARSAIISSRIHDTDFERIVTIGIDEYYSGLP